MNGCVFLFSMTHHVSFKNNLLLVIKFHSLKKCHFHTKGTVEKYNKIIAQMNIRKKYKMPIWPVDNQRACEINAEEIKTKSYTSL